MFFVSLNDRFIRSFPSITFRSRREHTQTHTYIHINSLERIICKYFNAFNIWKDGFAIWMDDICLLIVFEYASFGLRRWIENSFMALNIFFLSLVEFCIYQFMHDITNIFQPVAYSDVIFGGRRIVHEKIPNEFNLYSVPRSEIFEEKTNTGIPIKFRSGAILNWITCFIHFIYFGLTKINLTNLFKCTQLRNQFDDVPLPNWNQYQTGLDRFDKKPNSFCLLSFNRNNNQFAWRREKRVYLQWINL